VTIAGDPSLLIADAPTSASPSAGEYLPGLVAGPTPHQRNSSEKSEEISEPPR